MRAYDFINQSIGNKVYLTGDYDLAMDSRFKAFIYLKTPLTLIGLSKGGMAIVEHEGQQYKVAPRNVREFEPTENETT